MTAMKTAGQKLTETEFVAFVAETISRKVDGAALTDTRGGYRIEISTNAPGLYRIDVTSPDGQWTRRRDVAKRNIQRIAAELYAEVPEVTTIPVEDMKVGYRYCAVRSGYESNWTVKSIETREADVQVERNGETVTPILVIVTRRDGVSQTLEQGERIAIMGPFKGEPVE